MSAYGPYGCDALAEDLHRRVSTRVDRKLTARALALIAERERCACPDRRELLNRRVAHLLWSSGGAHAHAHLHRELRARARERNAPQTYARWLSGHPVLDARRRARMRAWVGCEHELLRAERAALIARERLGPEQISRLDRRLAQMMAVRLP